MTESAPVIDKIGVAFGTYRSPEGVLATMEELLRSEFSLHDLCVVGPLRSLSQSLKLLQKEPGVDAGRVSLFAQTESFFIDDDITSSVGSKGRLLLVVKDLMDQRRNCMDVAKKNGFSITSAELKKRIAEGGQTLFVSTGASDLLVPALRILIRRSAFTVQSHEIRR